MRGRGRKNRAPANRAEENRRSKPHTYRTSEHLIPPLVFAASFAPGFFDRSLELNVRFVSFRPCTRQSESRPVKALGEPLAVSGLVGKFPGGPCGEVATAEVARPHPRSAGRAAAPDRRPRAQLYELARRRIEAPHEILDWAKRDRRWSFTLAEIMTGTLSRPRDLATGLVVAIADELEEESEMLDVTIRKHGDRRLSSNDCVKQAVFLLRSARRLYMIDFMKIIGRKTIKGEKTSAPKAVKAGTGKTKRRARQASRRRRTTRSPSARTSSTSSAAASTATPRKTGRAPKPSCSAADGSSWPLAAVADELWRRVG